MNQVEEIAPAELKLSTPFRVKAFPITAQLNRRGLGIALCALAGVSYGIQAPLAKLAYDNGINVSTMLALRFLFATLGIWGMVAYLRTPVRQSRKTIVGLTFLGAIFVANSLTFYMALHEMAAGTTSLLVFSYPALVVVWSAIFFKESLTVRRGMILALALLGCALTVDPATALAPGQNFSWLGVFLAIASAVSSSFYVLLSGKFGRGVPGLVAAAWGVPVTAFIYTAWALATGQFQFQLSPMAWLCALAIGLGTAFSVAAFLKGLQLIGPSRAAITATSEPATTVLISVLLLGEPASPIKLAGGALIVLAVILLSRPSEG